MDYKLSMKPLEDGGTVLLEYDPEIQDKMERVIMCCGREDLVICSVPIFTEGRYTIHLISDNLELEDFWDACVAISMDDYEE